MRFLYILFMVFVALGVVGCCSSTNLYVTNNSPAAIHIRQKDERYLGTVASGQNAEIPAYDAYNGNYSRAPAIIVTNGQGQKVNGVRVTHKSYRTYVIVGGARPHDDPSPIFNAIMGFGLALAACGAKPHNDPSPAFNVITGLGLALAAYGIQITLSKRNWAQCSP